MHTKVDVRVAHLLGMRSAADFRVSGLEVRTALIFHIKVEVRVAHLLGMRSPADFRVSGLEVRTALILCAHQSRS